MYIGENTYNRSTPRNRINMMKHTKHFYIPFLTYLILLISGVIISQKTLSAENPLSGNTLLHQASDSLRFRWALVGAKKSAKDWKIFSVRKDTALKTGDNLMFYFEPSSACYVYLFLHDSQGKIHLLLPSSSEKMSTPLSTAERYFVPQRGSGMELDENLGDETFFLIVSSDRLKNLEAAYKEIETDYAGTRKMLNEIRLVLKKGAGISGFAAVVPESMGGTLRGIGSDLQKVLGKIDFEKYAFGIHSNNLYTKKIVIEHR